IARISRYNYKSKLQRLDVEKLSRASADQRAGRCGRIKPGTCVRLYAQDDFDKREAFTDPEILRTNLASVILQMAVLKLGRIRDFPFLDKPDRRFVKDGYRLLEQLEAVDDDGGVTRLGRKISRYPLDPRLGKILVESVEDGCLGEVQIIAACLSAGDPRERPWEQTEQADACHKKFADSASDFVTLLNIWNEWESLPGKQKERRKWCKKNYMSYRRMLEWQDIWRQLQRVAREQGHVINERAAKSTQLHITILKGFLDNIGERKTEHTYTGARGRVFRIFPGSGLHKRNPRWVVAAEVVQTSQVFARCVAKINPDWIEIAARHLTRNRCIDTFWSSKRACAMGVEEISLFGFVLSRRRRVHLAKYSRADARTQFIRHALVDNDWSCDEDFVDRNEQLRQRFREFEIRMRRFMIDAEKQFNFFYERLPVEVVDRRSFRQWWNAVRPNRPDYLDLAAADIGADLTPQPAWYPDTMTVAGQEVALSYVFDPDDARDGVTLNLPAVLLSYLQAAQIEWLIPGWLLDKTETMLRGLQKRFRRQLQPIADRAKAFVRWAIVEELPGGEESLGAALSRFVQTEHGLTIAKKHWAPERTPPWMRMGIALLDSDGKEIDWDRDLDVLTTRHGQSTVMSALEIDSEWLRRDVRSWDFDPLPEAVTVQQGGLSVNVCPALIDKKHRVDMELLPTLEEAERVHGSGVCRLMAGLLHDKVRYLEKNLAELSRINILYLQVGEGDSVYDDLIMAALAYLVPDAHAVRTTARFNEQLAKCRAALIGEAQKSGALVLSILTQRQKLLMLLDAEKNRFSSETLADMRQQLDELVHAGFVLKTPAQWLLELPRYLQAQEIRAQKIINSGQEPEMAQSVMERAAHWRSLSAEQRQQKPDYQWMIEEWRVSVFAQHLGTRIPVSQKRIEKYLNH
ncbi:MAG: ATP-dependent RNA helicase HrpA, partial [Gammaproteobacteria bacterium]|nr:ATP-dependent RNA helicase HrpA [Gammaproteobacteria bacterium]